MAKKGAKAKSSSKRDYKKIGDEEESQEPKSRGKGGTGRKSKGGSSSRKAKRNGFHSNHDDAGLYAAIEAGKFMLAREALANCLQHLSSFSSLAFFSRRSYPPRTQTDLERS